MPYMGGTADWLRPEQASNDALKHRVQSVSTLATSRCQRRRARSCSGSGRRRNNRDAGKGAGAGAAMGGLAGGFRRRDERRQQASAQASDTSAAMSKQQTAYNRAMAACLQGRGYNVN